MQFDKEQLKQQFGDQVRFDEALSKYTTFKIGGPAKVFLMPKTNEALMDSFRFVLENHLPYFILGGGSNVLMSDAGFDGVVIKPRNTELRVEGDLVHADAGVVLGKVAALSAKSGLTGLEWGIAVPGNVGGAVRGNAGAFGGEIKDTLVSAQVFDGKELKTLSNAELQFSYRTSRIKREGGKEIVISATFKLVPADAAQCQETVKKFLDKKFQDQPMGELCAGCLFKNIEVDGQTKALRAPSKGEPTERFMQEVPEDFWTKGKVPAGWLIEKAGLKGYTQKGVKVSEKHANFLVNIGTGNAEAVKELADSVKTLVRKQFGVELEEEVEMLS
jgi:UDP-N-acetylmuramate dehydrogenase